MLYARTKVRRDATGWVSQSVSTDLKRVIDDEQFMRELADDYAALYKRPVDIAVLKGSLRRAAEKTVEGEEKRRFFLSQMFDTAKLVCNKVLLQRAWQVWEAPIHQQFITSDNPVITMLPINGDFAPGFGFNAAGVLVAFPLNWKSCLIVGRNQKSFRTADSQEVERANEIQIRSMLHNVYSHTKSTLIENAVNEYGATSRFGENAFIVPGDRLWAVKELLKKRIEQKRVEARNLQ